MTKFKAGMMWLLAVAFVAAGANHFVQAERYVRIVPAYLPWPDGLVWVSGVFEVLGGVGLLVPRLRVAAAWGLIALLVAVFPANVYMALNPEVGAELFPALPAWAWWARLPFQGVFIAWAYWFTRTPTGET
jgi:uncharacterized membrane protein